MTAAYGVTPAGFVVKPTTQILADMQAQAWASPALGPTLDLSSQTPDGQLLGIVAAQAGSLWELSQIAYNQYNRQDTEGAGLDNLGDVTGTPREGATYTQVYCDLVFDSSFAGGTFAPGALVGNVQGDATQVYANVATITLSAGAQSPPGMLFQATTIGPTPAVNPFTLNVITTPVAGWDSIVNPGPQSQLGQDEESDAAYGPRQAQDVAAGGSCNPAATAVALLQLAAAQSPPVTLTVLVIENPTAETQIVDGITMPPNTYSAVIYDHGTGWASIAANQALIAQTIYQNKPAGISPIGNTLGLYTDPNLGPQVVAWTIPTGAPLFITVHVVPRANVDFNALRQSIQSALVAAAVAPTPATGVPPLGQLNPGSPVIGSQEQAVVTAVQGVFDVHSLTFGFSASPTNTAPLVVPASQVATILASTAATNIVIVEDVGP